MKTILRTPHLFLLSFFKQVFFLVCILLVLKSSQVLADPLTDPNCDPETPICTTVDFTGFTFSGRSITLSFTVIADCPSALSFISFKVPKNAVFTGSPSQFASPTNGFQVEINNRPSWNYKEIKFEETSGEGPKNGEQVEFKFTFSAPPSYTTPAEIQAYLESELKSILLSDTYLVHVKSGRIEEDYKIFHINDKGELDCDLTPLPVTLVSFDGAYQTNQGVSLKWITASEVNNEYFQIQRSQDGETFTSIGQVKGNGSTNGQHTYNYTDKSVGTGTYYYRLKQVDFSGQSEFSKVIAVKTNGKISHYAQVYPNPTAESLKVDLSTLAAGAYSLKIASLTGVILRNHTLPAGQITSLDVQNLANGAYIVIIEGQRFKEVVRFFKN